MTETSPACARLFGSIERLTYPAGARNCLNVEIEVTFTPPTKPQAKCSETDVSLTSSLFERQSPVRCDFGVISITPAPNDACKTR